MVLDHHVKHVAVVHGFSDRPINQSRALVLMNDVVGLMDLEPVVIGAILWKESAVYPIRYSLEGCAFLRQRWTLEVLLDIW